MLTPFYTFQAYKYNARTSIFVSLWPWALYYFDRTVERRRVGDALALGLFVAAALLSKYFALILVATMLIAALHAARPQDTVRLPCLLLGRGARGAARRAAYRLAGVSPTRGRRRLRYLGTVSGLGPLAALDNMQMTLFGSLADLAAPIALVRMVRRRQAPRLAAPDRNALARAALSPTDDPRLRPAGAGARGGAGHAGQARRGDAHRRLPAGAAWLLQSRAGRPPKCPRGLDVETRGGADRPARSPPPPGSPIGAPALPQPALRQSTARGHRRRRQISGGELTGLPLVYVAGTRFYDDVTAFYGPDKAHGLFRPRTGPLPLGDARKHCGFRAARRSALAATPIASTKPLATATRRRRGRI